MFGLVSKKRMEAKLKEAQKEVEQMKKWHEEFCVPAVEKAVKIMLSRKGRNEAI